VGRRRRPRTPAGARRPDALVHGLAVRAPTGGPAPTGSRT
jgi:hypothetical protein